MFAESRIYIRSKFINQLLFYIYWTLNKDFHSFIELGILKICILPENSAEGLGPGRECCKCYIVSVFEKTPQNLVVQEKAQLENSTHVVKRSVLGLHAYT